MLDILRLATNTTETATLSRERRILKGITDDAKATAKAAAQKAARTTQDTVERAKDKVAEVKADVRVKQAEAEQSSVEHRNEVKKTLRDN